MNGGVVRYRRAGGAGLLALLTLSVMGLPPPCAQAEDQTTEPAASQPPAAHHFRKKNPVDPALGLSRMLGLDERQQAELRKVLQSQREEVRRLWTEQSVPEIYRASEMRAISERTEVRIRALLNEEQRKLYIQKQQPEGPGATQKASLEDWLDATRPKSGSGEGKAAPGNSAPEAPQ
ncbi:MAG TPA: hypothetical protein VF931_06150 [Steroidobacteraceae bacterium]